MHFSNLLGGTWLSIFLHLCIAFGVRSSDVKRQAVFTFSVLLFMIIDITG